MLSTLHPGWSAGAPGQGEAGAHQLVGHVGAAEEEAGERASVLVALAAQDDARNRRLLEKLSQPGSCCARLVPLVVTAWMEELGSVDREEANTAVAKPLVGPKAIARFDTNGVAVDHFDCIRIERHGSGRFSMG